MLRPLARVAFHRALLLSAFTFLPTAVFAQDAAAPNRVSGRVWEDADRDGRQGGAEPGVEGVTVQLLDGYGRAIDGVTTTTDAAGAYVLEGMADGDYRVALVRPDGYCFTRSEVGSKRAAGTTVDADTYADDSDLNLVNGHFDPSRRGPRTTGMSYFEWTRIENTDEPWPVNTWVVYPADRGEAGAKATIGELYAGDGVDQNNTLAATKLAIKTVLGGDPDDATLADSRRSLQDTEARVDAPLADDGPFPVVILFSGLLGGVADLVDLADLLASHGYIALCLESTAFHSSVALGGRLSGNGGPWEQSDFDHIPQLDGMLWDWLLDFGYEEAGYIMGRYNASPASQAVILADDVAFALDQAQAWNARAGHRFEGAFDLARVGWIGFSAGAGRSGVGVTTDERVDLVVNIDSATFLNVPKPMIWVGNANGAPGGGPNIQARLNGDFHPHYISVPAINFEPPVAEDRFHREFHQEIRDELVTSFCGLYLKDVLAYREDLGVSGFQPTFDGYIGPYLLSNFPGWQGARFRLEGGAEQEFDAGLVPARLWIVDANRVHALDTSFLAGGGLTGAVTTDYGPILVDAPSGWQRLTDAARGLAMGTGGSAWFTAGTPPSLYEFDTADVQRQGIVVARPLGRIAGLPADVEALAYEPRSAQLVVLTSGGELFVLPATASPRARHLGSLPASGAAAAGLDVDDRGRLWVADATREALARVSLGTVRELGTLALPTYAVTRTAFDCVSKLIFVLDGGTGELVSVDPADGAVVPHGSLTDLGFGAAPSLAFERAERAASDPSPFLRAVDSDPAAGPLSSATGPRAVLFEVDLTTPAAGWGGFLLRCQVAEGSGDPAIDRLSLEPGGALALGNRAEVHLPELLIGEAREVLWNGQLVAWLETDWDLALGGRKIAPLRVAFTGDATTAAVVGVLEALRHDGPLKRRIEVTLTDAAGQRGLAQVVEPALD